MRSGILLGTVAIAVCLPSGAAAYCLEYGTNRLSGTLAPQTYPGPPDFKSVTSGDKPLVIWVLLLDERICVVDSSNRLPNEYYEREVQLVLEDAQYQQYRNLLGRRITVTGTLQAGYADYKRLLFVPRAIERARARP